MVEFLKNAMDWVLDKESEVAKKCVLKPEEIDEQIASIEKKREQLRKKFEEEDAEFEHILKRLSIIKAESMKCESK